MLIRYVVRPMGRLQWVLVRRVVSPMKRALARDIGPSPTQTRVYDAFFRSESGYSKRALLLYLASAMALPPESARFTVHQNYRGCRFIASILDELGYIVDVGFARDLEHSPPHEYDLLVSDKGDDRQVRPTLRHGAKTIFLATTLEHRRHNANIKMRHERLQTRRGCTVEVRRKYAHTLPFAARVDAIAGFGNDFIMSTWQPVNPGPRLPFNNFSHREVPRASAKKNFEAARRNFLFFASASQIQKGLDLLLEIFPRHPELHLYVCSNYLNEPDFCACYKKELQHTPNIHGLGRIQITGRTFRDLVDRCAYVIGPTASDGQSGAVVNCMAAGLIPVVTREAGIDTAEFGVMLADDTLEEIERVVVELAGHPPEWHARRATLTQEVASREYSEEAFVARWRAIIREVTGDQ